MLDDSASNAKWGTGSSELNTNLCEGRKRKVKVKVKVIFFIFEVLVLVVCHGEEWKEKKERRRRRVRARARRGGIGSFPYLDNVNRLNAARRNHSGDTSVGEGLDSFPNRIISHACLLALSSQ